MIDVKTFSSPDELIAHLNDLLKGEKKDVGERPQKPSQDKCAPDEPQDDGVYNHADPGNAKIASSMHELWSALGGNELPQYVLQTGIVHSALKTVEHILECDGKMTPEIQRFVNIGLESNEVLASTLREQAKRDRVAKKERDDGK